MPPDSIPPEFDTAVVRSVLNLQADFLNDAFDTFDPALIAAALGELARARGMTRIARTAGVQRENLYRALSRTGHPELATIIKVVQAMGFRLVVLPAEMVEY